MRPPAEETPRWDDAEYQTARRRLKAQRREVCEHPDCLAPHLPIDYDSPTNIIGSDGKRRQNPWGFEADHVIARALGGGHELRPTHRACNRQAGAKLGARRRWGSHTSAGPVHTRDW